MGQIFSANDNQRNKQTKEVGVKDKGIEQTKDVEDCHVLPSKDVKNEKIQQVDSKDERKHDLSSRVPPQIQQLHQNQNQATGKYIPPFQRNKQETRKHMNKVQIPTMKQNLELGRRNEDAIGKVDCSTSKQILKDGHLMNDVSKRECLSLNKEILWLNHYNNGQRILLVGEADFSFSASLVVAFGSSGSNIVATSHDSSEFLRDNYRNAIANIEKLTCGGATIMHRLDATKMAIHPHLRLMKFDRIIYNFPYSGIPNCKPPRSKTQKQKKKLVGGFLSNAKKMMKEDGEIHMSHNFDWDVNELALLEGLCLVGEVKFDPADYPGYGYETKYGFGGDDKNLDCNPTKTYIWRIVSTGLLR